MPALADAVAGLAIWGAVTGTIGAASAGVNAYLAWQRSRAEKESITLESISPTAIKILNAGTRRVVLKAWGILPQDADSLNGIAIQCGVFPPDDADIHGGNIKELVVESAVVESAVRSRLTHRDALRTRPAADGTRDVPFDVWVTTEDGTYAKTMGLAFAHNVPIDGQVPPGVK